MKQFNNKSYRLDFLVNNKSKEQFIGGYARKGDLLVKPRFSYEWY